MVRRRLEVYPNQATPLSALRKFGFQRFGGIALAKSLAADLWSVDQDRLQTILQSAQLSLAACLAVLFDGRQEETWHAPLIRYAPLAVLSGHGAGQKKRKTQEFAAATLFVQLPYDESPPILRDKLSGHVHGQRGTRIA